MIKIVYCRNIGLNYDVNDTRLSPFRYQSMPIEAITPIWFLVVAIAPIPLGNDLFPTMPTSADFGTYVRAATIGNNRQKCAVPIFWLSCSHTRYAVDTIKIRLIHDVLTT